MQLEKKLTASGNVLVLLSLMYFITYVDRVNISTAAPAIKGEFGLSNTVQGYMFCICLSLCALPGIRRLAWRQMGGAAYAVPMRHDKGGSTILTGLAGGLASLFGVRFMLGFGEGADRFPTATRAMQNWVARDRRGFAQGFVHSAARLGNAITPRQWRR